MKLKLLALFALPLLISSAFAANTLTYNVNTLVSGTVLPAAPAPWLIVTLTDNDLNSDIRLTITSNLTTPEFFGAIGFSLSDTFSTVGSRSFDTNSYTSIGGFTQPTVTIGNDIKNGGAGEKYDVWFDLATENAQGGIHRFGNNDTFSYTLKDFSLNDFGTGNNSVGAHIQSLNNGESAWVSGGPQINNLPEPSCVLLGGVGLLTLFRRRRG